MIPARWGISLTALSCTIWRWYCCFRQVLKRNQSAVANPKEVFVFENQNVCSGKDAENTVIWTKNQRKIKITGDKKWTTTYTNRFSLDTCMRNMLNLILARLLMIALLTFRLGIRWVNKWSRGAKGKRKSWPYEHPFKYGDFKNTTVERGCTSMHLEIIESSILWLIQR